MITKQIKTSPAKPCPPLWQAVLKAHEENLCDYRAGITPNQLKEVIKEKQIEIHLQQIVGNAASIAALEGLTDTEIREEFTKQIIQTIQNRTDHPSNTFWENINKTRKRATSWENGPQD